MNGNIYIIGAGGVGSWLAHSLCKLVSPKQVILMDGDTLETRNLDRQLFGVADVGKNKAEVLGQRLGCTAIPQYFSSHTRDYGPMDWLICCADNNAARRACLDDADRAELAVIIAANEKTSAEAYYYNSFDYPSVFELLDPRVYYPELLTDNAPDPRATAIGCVGEAQKQTPQLVSANFMAAALAQWLFVLWALEVPNMPEMKWENLPYRLVANASRLETHLIRDALRKDNK
jgi:molybdopterin/thiamine biosynthesis adenylyltransferase